MRKIHNDRQGFDSLQEDTSSSSTSKQSGISETNEMSLSQHPVESGLLQIPSQEMPSIRGLAENKRKQVSSSPYERKASRACNELSAELSDHQAPPNQLQMQQPPLQQPAKHAQVTLVQVLLHHPQDSQPQQQQSLSQEPRQQYFLNPQPLNQVASVCCDVCNVDCVTRHNFRLHMQGKKHRAKCGEKSVKVVNEISLQLHSRTQESPQKDTGLAWCSLCNVNCNNAENLRRHLQGKPHKAKWDKHSPQVEQKARLDRTGSQPPRTPDKQPIGVEKGPVWCTLCMLNCRNPENLRRHLKGKKHHAKWNEQPIKAHNPEDLQSAEIQVAPIVAYLH